MESIDYCKRVYRATLQMLLYPAEEWNNIKQTSSSGRMLSEFLYPMIMFCGSALILGRIISNGISLTAIYSSLVDAAMCTFSMLAAYYLATPAIGFITAKLTDSNAGHDTVSLFTGYSMTVVLVLVICTGIFPQFSLLALILQFYTLRVVWEGASVLLDVRARHRFTYTVIVSFVIVALPVITNKVIGLLTSILN